MSKKRRRPHTISFDPDVYDEIQRVADIQYDGKFNMAARMIVNRGLRSIEKNG